MTIVEDGSPRTVSKLELMFKQIVDQGAGGNLRAFGMIAKRVDAAQNRAASEQADVLDEADQEVLASINQAHSQWVGGTKPMTVLTRQELQAFMRCDLPALTHRAFRHLHPTEPFQPNWHIDLILAKLEECRTGKCKRLIICQPPRSLKSICASVVFPAWVLGHDPTRRIMCVSYAQELADKHARDCRSVVSSGWYQKLFPRMRLSEHRQAVAEFTATVNGSRIATSVGGVVTGLGADFIIIDDPLKPDDALSEIRRKAANEWIKHTLYSRLNNKKTGVIVIVMQRLHEDDLVGHVLRETGERWEVLSLPAVAAEPQTFAWETLLGRHLHLRAVGDVLHPELEPFEQLEIRRRSLESICSMFGASRSTTPVSNVRFRNNVICIGRTWS